MSYETPDFRPERMLGVLAEHDVQYILIGGLAAVLHGSPLNTNDADLCPERSTANLSRLASALRALDARIRTSAEPNGLEFACDTEFLERTQIVNLVTPIGWIDISFFPGAFPSGYEELLPHAVPVEVGDFVVQVASLHDVILSKQAANRSKDQAALPYLYALEDEIAALEREARE